LSRLDAGDLPRTAAQRDALALDLFARAGDTDDDRERHELLDQVVLLYAEVAQGVASRYRGRGLPAEDLCQAAYEGLVKATQRFDPSRRHDFLSYAVPTIRGEVQRHFRDHGWTVRPPRRLQDLQWRMHRAIDGLYQELGREPSSSEVAEELEVTPEQLDEAHQAYGSFAPTSLDLPVLDDGASSLADVITGDDHDSLASEARLVLAPLVRKLSARDQRVLYLRFCCDWTQQEIGDDIGVTQMQVSRTLTRILRTLRSELDAAA
jgi:RNA polymerase sigma-B factor